MLFFLFENALTGARFRKSRHKGMQLCEYTRFLSYVQTGATTPNIVGPTLCWELLRPCWQWYRPANEECETTLNNVVTCSIVGRVQLIRLWGPCVMCVRVPSNVRRAVRLIHCSATLWRSQDKRNFGSCWLKRLTGFSYFAHPRRPRGS